MITLLAKDFKLMFGNEKGLLKKLLSILFSIFFIACFVGIEVFLFTTILTKIGNFHQAPSAFISLFLFIISVIVTISSLFNALKLFFNEKDIEQLSVHPVSNSSIILSKLIFLFLSHYATCFIFVYPLIIAYGQIHPMHIKFYYIGLFYPVLSFLFEVGIVLLFVYPFYFFKEWLKKHLVVKFIINTLTLVIGCILYSQVLSLFIEIVAGNNINSLFTTESIGVIVNLKRYLIPTSFLSDLVFAGSTKTLLPYLGIALGFFVFGVSIVIFLFNYVRNISLTKNYKIKEKKYKEKPVWQSLVKKEVILLAKNADYTFSFTGLLIVQPFLAFLVIKALNTIFTSGVFSYYISMVPNFVPLMDMLILMLFSAIISQGANSYIQMEKRTIKIMKTIPVKYSTQLLIKVSIPYLLSFASLLLTLLVLLISGSINLLTFICGIILVGLFLLLFDIISLKEELSIRNHVPRSTTVSNLYSYLFPLGFFIVTALLSYIKLPLIVAYAMGLVLVLAVGVPYSLKLKKNMSNLFMELDVIN